MLLHSYALPLAEYLATQIKVQNPVGLYEPIDYIMSLDAKRIRPLMLLHSHKIFGGNIQDAMPLAAAVELFHNFTLMHDDIMDNADMRRGQAAVHVKYDTNTAILSGDLMLIQSYQMIGKCAHHAAYPELMRIFNEMSVQLCEGQQWDVEFEQRNDVTIDEYIQMITYKTSVLIAAAMQMGALLAGANESDQQHIYEYGKNIGIAFQIQDDILDAFGEKAKVGKRIGGDIVEGKKTYLYLKAMELASDAQKSQLYDYMNDVHVEDEVKIREVMKIFKNTHVRLYADQVKEAYRDLAFSHLQAVQIKEEDKEALKEFGQWLLERSK